MLRADRSQWAAITPTAVAGTQHMVSNIDLVQQKPYRDLCWAACATMILRHLQQAVDLPTVVTTVLGDFADQTAWPQHVYIDI